MGKWASAIVHDPSAYPMGATVPNVFAGVPALARVEWHTWTNRGGKRVNVDPPIRGVTVYDMSGQPAPTTCNPNVMTFMATECEPPPPDVYPWDVEVPAVSTAAISNVGRALAVGMTGLGAYLLTRWLVHL
jgi:hypothetical protein